MRHPNRATKRKTVRRSLRNRCGCGCKGWKCGDHMFTKRERQVRQSD